MSQIKTPRPRRDSGATAATSKPKAPDSTPAVEPVKGGGAPQAAPNPAPVPALVPLQAAAQRVMEATLMGVPLALTRGIVVARDSGSKAMSLPPWVGCLPSHTSVSGRVLSPDTVYLSLYQGIAQPASPEFQTYGLDHQGYGGSRLQKPMTITLGENRMHTVPEDMTFIQEVQEALIGKDLFLLSLDRLRLYQRSNSGKPISDNIILEAFDPATGELVWRNPRISVDHAISATAAALGSSPAPAATPLRPQPMAPAATAAIQAPAPAPAPASLPAWLVNLRSEAEGFGILGENLVRYIVSKRASVLVAAGVASSEAEAASMATAEVQGFLGTKPAPASAVIQPPPPVAAPVAMAQRLGLSAPAPRPVPMAKPAPAPRRAPVATGPLPEAIELEHLSNLEWRPQVSQRIQDFLRTAPNQSATAQVIRAGIGLPVGFQQGTDLERIGNCLKRFLYRMEGEGLIVGEGTTRARTYRLL